MTSPPLDLSHLHEGDSGNFEPMEDEPLSDASAYAESVDVTSEKVNINKFHYKLNIELQYCNNSVNITIPSAETA